MKTLSGLRCLWVSGLLFAGACALGGARMPQDALLVDVDEGVHRVRLEMLDEVTGKWNVLSIAYVDGSAGTVKFRVPGDVPLERFRVFTHATPAPMSALRVARHTFVDWGTEADYVPMVSFGGVESPDADGLEGAPREGGETTVEEPDIWRLVGDRLYFFNQMRGLQVFDLSDPADSVMTGSLRLPFAGEQMFVLDSGHVLLLASRARGWENDTDVHVVAVPEEGDPAIVRTLTVRGMVRESRLVGSRLVLASGFYGAEAPDDGPWDDPDRPADYVYTPHVLLAEIDFSDPADPRETGRRVYPGFVRAVTSTPEHFILAHAPQATLWGEPDRVTVFALNDRDEAVLPVAALTVAGRVQDKFKLNLNGDILTTISHESPWGSGSDRMRTRLETWRLDAVAAAGEAATDSIDDSGEFTRPPPGDPDDEGRVRPLPEDEGAQRLGDLILGEGESLFATRFDGDRAYVVTFLQIDPLYVVDLSDPVRPRVTGELEIPGFSTYLEPMGDRMLAVGVEDRRVTAMLFDVGDPANPSEIRRVHLGPEDGYTWSEANYDEKAVTILRDAGLMLAPFQTWSGGGHESYIQLLSFDRDSLVKNGTIAHSVAARRAAALDAAHLVSISARELFVVDVTDRDDPVERAKVTLSWRTDRVFPIPGYLVHLTSGPEPWGGNTSARLTVTAIDAPDHVAGELDLGPERVLDAVWEDGFLHLARTNRAWGPYWWWWREPWPGEGGEDEEPYVLVQSVDLRDPMNPLAGEPWKIETDSPYMEVLGTFPLADGTRVWALGSVPLGWYWATDGPGAGGAGTRDKRAVLLAAARMDAEGAVEGRSLVSVPVDEGAALSAAGHGDRIFLSMEEYRYSETRPSWSVYYNTRMVDYAAPDEPVTSRVFSMPGIVQSVADAGPDGIYLIALQRFYRQEPSFTLHTRVYGLFFDGAAMYLLSDDELPGGWGAHASSGLLLASADNDHGEQTYGLEIRRFDPRDGFRLEARIEMERAIHSLRAEDGSFFAVLPEVLLRVREAGSEWRQARFPVSARLWLDLRNAAFSDGEVNFPLGDYGVFSVDLSEAPAPDGMFGVASADAAVDGWMPAVSAGLRRASARESDAVGKLVERDWLFRPTGFARVDPAARDLGDGWRDSPSFGRHSEIFAPWLFVDGYAWLYHAPAATGGLFLHHADSGWFHTDADWYPFLYEYASGEWFRARRSGGRIEWNPLPSGQP
ncbi:MAG: beta-propeller domain-containing protein [Opitutales bacterium]|nr:beta-propeller domain-containing protein [Opitutales bacterium]